MPRSKDKKSKRTKPVPVKVEDLTPPENPKGGTLAAPFIPGGQIVSAAVSGLGSAKKA